MEGLEDHLQSLPFNHISLSYIIRDDEALDEDTYNMLEGPARQIYTAPLQGTHYKNDNFQVFQHLRMLIIGGWLELTLKNLQIVVMAEEHGAIYWHATKEKTSEMQRLQQHAK